MKEERGKKEDYAGLRFLYLASFFPDWRSAPSLVPLQFHHVELRDRLRFWF